MPQGNTMTDTLDRLKREALEATQGEWERRIGRLGNGAASSQHEQIALAPPADRGVVMLEHDGSDEANANARHIARYDPKAVGEMLELLGETRQTLSYLAGCYGGALSSDRIEEIDALLKRLGAP